jgi:hypothetical protein
MRNEATVKAAPQPQILKIRGARDALQRNPDPLRVEQNRPGQPLDQQPRHGGLADSERAVQQQDQDDDTSMRS